MKSARPWLIPSLDAAAMPPFEQMGLAKEEGRAAQENYDLVNEAYLEGEAAMIEQIDAQRQLIEAAGPVNRIGA